MYAEAFGFFKKLVKKKNHIKNSKKKYDWQKKFIWKYRCGATANVNKFGQN